MDGLGPASEPYHRGIVAIRVTPNRILIATLIAYSVLALAIALLTPPGEANDEPSHVRNVENILRGGLYRITPNSGSESHQAPLYYLTLAGWQRVSGIPPFRYLTSEWTQEFTRFKTHEDPTGDNHIAYVRSTCAAPLDPPAEPAAVPKQ